MYQWSHYTAKYAEARRGLDTGWGCKVSGKDLSALNLPKQSFEGEEKETRNSAVGEGNIEEKKKRSFTMEDGSGLNYAQAKNPGVSPDFALSLTRDSS